MDENEQKSHKIYYSISEVSQMFGVNASLIRFWESEIPSLRPKIVGSGVRRYDEKDIEKLRTVYNLVKVRGFKLSAARKMLRANKEGADKSAEVIDSLISVKNELKELKKQLDALE